MTFYMLALPESIQALLTILILGVLVACFVVAQKLLDPERYPVKKFNIILAYTGLFVFLILGIIGVLFIWGFDPFSEAQLLLAQVIDYIETKVGAIVASLLVILLSLAIFKITRLAFSKLGKSSGFHQRRKKTIAKISVSIIKYIIGILAILIILSFWGVNVLPALAGLGIAGLVIGLGAQKFINDLISGFFIIFEHHFDVGDKIEVKGFKGEVTDIGLKTTKIKNWKGEVKILNNGDINDITNFSMYESVAVVEFGIAYRENVEAVTTYLQTKLPSLREILPQIIEDPVVLGVTNLNQSSVDLRIIAKTRNEEHYGVERVMRQKIKEWLDEAGIEIPFPQVVLNQPKTNKN